MKPSCNARSICVWHRYSHEIALKASRCHFAKLLAELGWPTSTTHSQTAHLHQTFISRVPDTASRIRWQNSAFALWAETSIIEPLNVDRCKKIFNMLLSTQNRHQTGLSVGKMRHLIGSAPPLMIFSLAFAITLHSRWY
jgi:hypothetical protein